MVQCNQFLVEPYNLIYRLRITDWSGVYSIIENGSLYVQETLTVMRVHYLK